MALIEVDDRIAQALRAQADVRDMTVQAFLQRIVDTASPVNPNPAFAAAEFDQSIDDASSDSPVLPNRFSRADIYIDHD